MAVPDFQSLTLPLLRLAATDQVQTRAAIERLAETLGLSSEEREELLPSGHQSRFANRVHWAIVYLQKAGLITRTARGVYAITERGQSVLLSPPDRLDRRFLSQFDVAEDERREAEETSSAVFNGAGAGTPEERIEAAVSEFNGALRADLLDRILSISPSKFEKLIVDLMLGMGYGTRGSGEHLGRTADGGIDGVINEDVLGLDRVYLQAKRYAPANSIGVEKIREFAGALDERGATKGVFVTTSRFAAPATSYAERSPKRLVLIDGDKLTAFLIQFGVAVRPIRTIELKRLDIDYFEEEAT